MACELETTQSEIEKIVWERNFTKLFTKTYVMRIEM